MKKNYVKKKHRIFPYSYTTCVINALTVLLSVSVLLPLFFTSLSSLIKTKSNLFHVKGTIISVTKEIDDYSFLEIHVAGQQGSILKDGSYEMWFESTYSNNICVVLASDDKAYTQVMWLDFGTLTEKDIDINIDLEVPTK